MISAWDDFPVHQSAEPVRLVATSDRNFYDRFIGAFEKCGLRDGASGAP